MIKCAVKKNIIIIKCNVLLRQTSWRSDERVTTCSAITMSLGRCAFCLLSIVSHFLICLFDKEMDQFTVCIGISR